MRTTIQAIRKRFYEGWAEGSPRDALQITAAVSLLLVAAAMVLVLLIVGIRLVVEP